MACWCSVAFALVLVATRVSYLTRVSRLSHRNQGVAADVGIDPNRCSPGVGIRAFLTRSQGRAGSLPCMTAQSEDQGELCAQLPGRAEFRAQRVIVGADGEIDRELAADLNDPASQCTDRQGPGFVPGREPVGGDDRRTADIPSLAEVVVHEGL